MKQLAVIALLALALLLGQRCAQQIAQPHQPHHLLARIQQEPVEPLDYPFTRFDHVDSNALVRVQLSRQDSSAFWIPMRSLHLTKFPCTHCHQGPLDHTPALAASDRKAHWDIAMAHAPAEIMQCSTCHDTRRLDQLRSLVGKPIAFDHSYKLCGQCHASELKDWVGGAHGKQIGGWAQPRVSQTCTGCHNPHAPAFPRRLPARYPAAANASHPFAHPTQNDR